MFWRILSCRHLCYIKCGEFEDVLHTAPTYNIGAYYMYLCVCMLNRSCLTLLYSMNHSPPGSSIHGILQARILEWVAMPSFRGSSLLLSHQGSLYRGTQTGRARCVENKGGGGEAREEGRREGFSYGKYWS